MHGPTTIIRLEPLQGESLATYAADQNHVGHTCQGSSVTLRCLISSLSRPARQASCTGSPRSLVVHSCRSTGLPQRVQETELRRSSIGCASCLCPFRARCKRHFPPGDKRGVGAAGQRGLPPMGIVVASVRHYDFGTRKNVCVLRLAVGR